MMNKEVFSAARGQSRPKSELLVLIVQAVLMLGYSSFFAVTPGILDGPNRTAMRCYSLFRPSQLRLLR